MLNNAEFCFYEFFAGSGMAREGLGNHWRCEFANDMDPLKKLNYIENWGAEHFDDRDVRDIKPVELTKYVDLVWASFPCQDLSVAGNGQGIGEIHSSNGKTTRSGAIWPFLDLMDKLRLEARKPPIIVFENVLGLLTLDQGRHFIAICSQLNKMGYRYGAMIIDAKHFLPQSRPRVFIVAISKQFSVPTHLLATEPVLPWHSPSLLRVHDAFPDEVRKNWIWWTLGEAPNSRIKELVHLINCDDKNELWHSPEETRRLIEMMAPAHLERLAKARELGKTTIGSLYLRMRKEKGVNRQRAEISFSSVIGCLRTPKGGASRCRIIVVDKGNVRTRLLSVDEASALMGLPENFVLPAAYQSAFRIIGDGLAVPTVRFLAERLLEPLVVAVRGSKELEVGAA